MKVLGIIPARGGSKGVPGKNILEFEGKPLIAYAIEAGQESRLLSHLIVNTEDEKIAQVAEAHHCEVMKRSRDLATDTANVVDAVLEVLQKYEDQEVYFDAVLLLQPTAPLRTGIDIDHCIELLEAESTDAVISMVSVGDHHPARMYYFENGRMKNCMPAYETSRRQDLPERYIRNGCIYLVRTKCLREEKTFMPARKSAYLMDPQWAVNIDTELDVLILEKLIQKWNRRRK